MQASVGLVLPWAVDTTLPLSAEAPLISMTSQAWKNVCFVDAHKPKLCDPEDVILKVTGSTVCGSGEVFFLSLSRFRSRLNLSLKLLQTDLHLMHGAIIECQKGDMYVFCLFWTG